MADVKPVANQGAAYDIPACFKGPADWVEYFKSVLGLSFETMEQRELTRAEATKAEREVYKIAEDARIKMYNEIFKIVTEDLQYYDKTQKNYLPLQTLVKNEIFTCETAEEMQAVTIKIISEKLGKNNVDAKVFMRNIQQINVLNSAKAQARPLVDDSGLAGKALRNISERLQGAHSVTEVERLALGAIQEAQRKKAVTIVHNNVHGHTLNSAKSWVVNDAPLPEKLKKAIKQEVQHLKSTRAVERVAVAMITGKGMLSARFIACIDSWKAFLRPGKEKALRSVALLLPRLLKAAFVGAAKGSWMAVKGMAAVTVGAMATIITAAAGPLTRPVAAILNLHDLRKLKVGDQWAHMNLWAKGWTAVKYGVAGTTGIVFTPLAAAVRAAHVGGHWSTKTYDALGDFADAVAKRAPHLPSEMAGYVAEKARSVGRAARTTANLLSTIPALIKAARGDWTALFGE